MSMWMWAPWPRASRSSGRSRPAASRRPSSGASGRSSGVSAETLTERFARGSVPLRVALERADALGQRAVAGASSRSASTHRPAYTSASAAVTVASPSRSTELATPRPHRCRGRPAPPRGVSPTMNRCARWRDAPGGGRAERGAAGLGVGDPHGRGDRRRRVGQLVEEVPSGAGRGRPASGRRAPRPRTGTARPGARGRPRRSPSLGCRAPASGAAPRTGTRPPAPRRSGGSRARRSPAQCPLSLRPGC